MKQMPVFNGLEDKHSQPKTKDIPWGSGNNPLQESDTIKKLWDQLTSRGFTINDILYGKLTDIFSESGLKKLEQNFQCNRNQLHEKLIDYLNSQQLNEFSTDEIFTNKFVYDIDVMGNLVIENTETAEIKTLSGQLAANILLQLNSTDNEDEVQEILENIFNQSPETDL